MDNCVHIIFIVILLWTYAVPIRGQCDPTTDYVGVNSPGSQNGGSSGNVNEGIVMLGAKTAYIVDCCGVVDSYLLEIDLQGQPSVDLYLQVWRPDGTGYRLIGQNQFTVTTEGAVPLNVPLGQEISVQPNDRIGWWSAISIIESKNNNGATNTVLTLATVSTVGDIIDWTGTGIQDSNSNYAIKVALGGGSAPFFTTPTTGSTFTLTNDQPINYVVTTIAYSDNDVGDVVTLTNPLPGATQFSYNSATGDIYVNTADLGPSTNSLTFTVTDQCGNDEDLTITITVTNTPPTIYDMPASVELSEDTTAEALLFTVNATDTADDFTCGFTGAVDATWPFTMRQIPTTQTYGIYVETNPNFDYNTKSSYALTLQCTDDWNSASDVEVFNVYLKKNQAPVVTNLQASTIVSTTTTIGTTVFTVSATDAENDQIYMSMTCDPAGCPFQIFDSGAVTLNQDISSWTTTGYDINVTVWDAKNTVGPKILTIIVKDINDPVLISNLPLASSYPVPENSALSTSVFQVLHSDQDSLQTRTWTMSSTPGAGLTYFSIDPSTGLISTTTSSIDYETLSAAGTLSFNFVVSVNDGTSTDTQPLTIDIINVNEAPAFSQSSYSLSANEGPANMVLGIPAFSDSDPDAGDTKSYSMDCGADTGRFYMDTITGQVKYQANYDTDTGAPTTVTCSVNVTDAGGLYDTATLNIYISDINDNTPFFTPTSYSDHISYYASVGTSVTTVTALDYDTSTFGTLTYTLDQSSLLNQYFAIDNTGKISVIRSPDASLGYGNSITITAHATDGGGLAATAPVTITIGDTTTTSTTTTTDRYRTFIEDSRNIVWLVTAVVLLAGISAYLIWLFYTCSGNKGWSTFMRSLCKRRKKLPRKWAPRREPRTPYTPSPPPKSTIVGTVRQPPPPKAQQQWRTSVEAPPPLIKQPQGNGQRYEFWKHTP